MGRHDDQVEALAGRALAPGETLLAVSRLGYNGRIRPNHLTLDVGVAAVDESVALPEPDPDAVVSFPTAAEMAVALTDRRLLLWSVGLTGRPKRALGAVPLRAVVGIEPDPAGRGGLRLEMRSGALVDLEVEPGWPVTSFVEALRGALTAVHPGPGPDGSPEPGAPGPPSPG